MRAITQYTKHVQLIDRIIKRETEGLTHADSMKQMPFPANCINWNLGHLLVYRIQMLGAVDGVSQADEAEWALYGNGSEPMTDSAKAIPMETLLARLDAASEALVTALENMPAERLSEVYDEERSMTVDAWLSFYLMFHESYHAGQLEPLRELALATK